MGLNAGNGESFHRCHVAAGADHDGEHGARRARLAPGQRSARCL